MKKEEIIKRNKNNIKCMVVVASLCQKGWKRPQISSYVLSLSKHTLTSRMAGYGDFREPDLEHLKSALVFKSFESYLEKYLENH